MLQQFECVIDEISDGAVWIFAVDLTDPSNLNEIMSIPVEKFHFPIGLGTIFYWNIYKDGNTEFVPYEGVWTREMLSKAKLKSSQMFKKLGWDKNEII
jgi:hypothetical protein